MANIKPIEQSSDKFVRRASVAGPDYTAGITNPRSPWAQSSVNAEGNYKAGVTAAANAGRFGKGVKRVGDAKWQKNALAKGPGRYIEGVTIAKDAWSAGFGPYQAAIAALNLPARGPRGSAQNLQRVALVANTNRQLYEKRSAA